MLQKFRLHHVSIKSVTKTHRSDSREHMPSEFNVQHQANKCCTWPGVFEIINCIAMSEYACKLGLCLLFAKSKIC